MIEKINKTKSWFSEKINKNDKSLARWTKNNPQIPEIEIKMGSFLQILQK